ncbi:unnamed protein product [Heterobilharzia americana]|nr:unnamed protein product [Heterobilharzia americana]
MTTEINQTAEQTGEFVHSKPLASNSSSVPSEKYGDEYKADDVPSVRLQVPVQRTYKECIFYALTEWRCACLTIIILTGIIIISSCGVQQLMISAHSPKSPNRYDLSYYNMKQNTWCLCKTSSMLIISGLIFLIYLIYLIESWQSRNWIRTTWLIDKNMAYNLVQYAHKLIPSILWQIKCYHYAHNTEQHRQYQSYKHFNQQQYLNISNGTNSKTVYKNSFIQSDYDAAFNKINRHNVQCTIDIDKKGETFTPQWDSNVNQIKCQRIVSMNKVCSFDLSKIETVWDMSDYISKLENFQLIELNLSTIFSFSDKQSFLEFQRQKQEFFTIYENFDIYMETEEICTFSNIVRFPKQLLIMQQSSKPPIYLKGITYLIATLFLCSFPLRIFIYAHKAKLHCTIHKVFGPKPVDDNSENSLKFIPLTNTSTKTTPYLADASISYKIPSLSNHIVTRNNKKAKQLMNYITQSSTNSSNNFIRNNEAVVLFNKHITKGSTRHNEVSNKTCRQYPQYISNEIEYNQRNSLNEFRHNKSMHKNNSINEDFDANNNGDDDDDELLSLDIRFDEYMKNKFTKIEDTNEESDYYDYELDSVLQNTNFDTKIV